MLCFATCIEDVFSCGGCFDGIFLFMATFRKGRRGVYWTFVGAVLICFCSWSEGWNWNPFQIWKVLGILVEMSICKWQFVYSYVMWTAQKDQRKFREKPGSQENRYGPMLTRNCKYETFWGRWCFHQIHLWYLVMVSPLKGRAWIQDECVLIAVYKPACSIYGIFIHIWLRYSIRGVFG